MNIVNKTLVATLVVAISMPLYADSEKEGTKYEGMNWAQFAKVIKYYDTYNLLEKNSLKFLKGEVVGSDRLDGVVKDYQTLLTLISEFKRYGEESGSTDMAEYNQQLGILTQTRIQMEKALSERFEWFSVKNGVITGSAATTLAGLYFVYQHQHALGDQAVVLKDLAKDWTWYAGGKMKDMALYTGATVQDKVGPYASKAYGATKDYVVMPIVNNTVKSANWLKNHPYQTTGAVSGLGALYAGYTYGVVSSLKEKYANWKMTSVEEAKDEKSSKKATPKTDDKSEEGRIASIIKTMKEAMQKPMVKKVGGVLVVGSAGVVSIYLISKSERAASLWHKLLKRVPVRFGGTKSSSTWYAAASSADELRKKLASKLNDAQKQMLEQLLWNQQHPIRSLMPWNWSL